MDSSKLISKKGNVFFRVNDLVLNKNLHQYAPSATETK